MHTADQLSSANFACITGHSTKKDGSNNLYTANLMKPLDLFVQVSAKGPGRPPDDWVSFLSQLQATHQANQ